MIDLTRLNGHRLIVNCDLIKFIEATPDTTLALVTGDKLIVRESPEEVMERVSAFRSSVFSLAWPDAAAALANFARAEHSDHYEVASATE